MANEEGCEVRILPSKEAPVQIGGVVSSCVVFRVLVYFNYISFYFYFLNAEAATVFLSIIEEKAVIDELEVNKRSKKYFLKADGNVIGKQITVEEKNGDGVKKSYAILKDKLNVFFASFGPLEIGLMLKAATEELKDCREND